MITVHVPAMTARAGRARVSAASATSLASAPSRSTWPPAPCG